MNLRDLSNASMLAITGEFLEKPPAHRAHGAPLTAREILLANPKLAPQLPDLESAHSALLALVGEGADGVSPALLELRAQEEATDVEHDQAVRCGFALATLAAMVAGDAGAPDAGLVALRDALYPAGAAAVNDSYVAESGSALAQEKRLTTALHKQLASIYLSVEGKRSSLAEFVEAQIRAGKHLGKLEAQKRKLQPAPTVADDDGAPTVNAVNAARIEWVQVMQLVVQLARRASLSELDRQTLLGRLSSEVAKLPQRPAKGAAAGSAPASSGPEGTPSKS